MCYSAQIEADYKRFIRMFGATIDIREFARLYWERAEGRLKAKLPKAMDDAFANPQSDAEAEIKRLIDRYNADQMKTLEEELFKQRARLIAAERALQTKTTKAATESKRIAGDKIEAALGRIDDIRRTELLARDSRIFPGNYAPVLIQENGQLVVRPMRYLCRLEGKPASYDFKYPGTYNARLDSLGGFWKPLFGYSHGLLVVDSFYENVKRSKMEGRVLAEGEDDENVILQFTPRDGSRMLVACLWSKWTAPGEPDLYSFAAITDEPPPEVADAGHDRCVVSIKPENEAAWLNPNSQDLAAQYAILEDKVRAYYEHKLAA
ncbi:SOS response-associated peptidase family protein [Paraburkholderia sp. LEh10]|uniref:SOS response-associated peptidase family protein n=1 Tax=Paraburkholderia sp. LEh10 TaxID=2821353 RepID=UPI001AE6903A|nr:SOS response-associated peptidase family protein [Paraburkholderia sp. LEh10]MBP0595072.1 SOS response-associated peptidase family protein [Paraburkholderia sp. LEh10]